MSTKSIPLVLPVSEARKRLKDLTQDPTGEIVLTRDGEPVGVFIGIGAWRAMQELLGLLRDPEALADSLAKHRNFQATGEADGVSLEELTDTLRSPGAGSV